MSGFRSKKMMSNDRFNISYSWTQPYTGYSIPLRVAQNNQHREAVNTELAVLDAVDNIVSHMSEYPEAERLLAKIFSSK
jgi:hypothetical protein